MGRVARIVGIVLAVLIVVAIALPFFLDANQFRPRLETELGRALGRDVKLGDLKLSLWSGAVTASDLSISDDPAFSKSPFLSAQSLSVGVDLSALIFSKKLSVSSLEVKKPEIALLQTPSGAWNFSSLGAKSPRLRAARVSPRCVRSSAGPFRKTVEGHRRPYRSEARRPIPAADARYGQSPDPGFRARRVVSFLFLPPRFKAAAWST